MPDCSGIGQADALRGLLQHIRRSSMQRSADRAFCVDRSAALRPTDCLDSACDHRSASPSSLARYTPRSDRRTGTSERLGPFSKPQITNLARQPRLSRDSTAFCLPNTLTQSPGRMSWTDPQRTASAQHSLLPRPPMRPHTIYSTSQLRTRITYSNRPYHSAAALHPVSFRTSISTR
jgi:hypothetical protein